MRGLTLLLAFGLAASDKLDRTYLPPPGAKTSGGDLGAVDAPFEVPKETPSTTIRPRPKYPVKPEDTQLTVGINRGQPTPVVPQGFTTGPFSSTYIPSTTTSIAYTQTTTFPPPEGFETTGSPIGPTGFPSTQRPGIYGQTQAPTLRPVYGPDGQVIGVTPTPGTVEVCEEGNGRCQTAQQVGPVYGPKGQIISQQPDVAPTQGTVQDLRPVYGPSGDIIGVTPTPGSVKVCKEGDVLCQKQAQQKVPVYGPNGQIAGYQPSATPSLGKIQGVQPAYGPNGQIIGQQPVVTPTPKPVNVCKEGDVECQIQDQQVPVYGPNGQIVGYQPSLRPTPGTVQSPSIQGKQTIPVYGPNGEIVGYQPSPGTVQGVQPVYGPFGQIIGQQPVPIPTLGSVPVCNEGDGRCLKQAQQNVPVYGPNGEIVGYQPSATPTPGTVQNLQPIYDSKGKIIEYQPTDLVRGCKEGDLQCQKQAQQYIPVQQPRVIPTPETVSGLQPVYDSNGKIIEYRPTGLVQGCKEGDLQCQKQAQQYIPVQQPGTVSGLQPVYDSNGKIIEYRPTGLVQGCKEGDLQCQKQAQQYIPVQQPGTVSGLQPVYDSNGKIIEYRPTGLVQGCKEGDVQCQKQDQQVRLLYGPSGQIIGQQPSATPTAGTFQGLQLVYDMNGKLIDHRPIGLVQGCKEGDAQCQKQAQQYTPAYESRQQPTVAPTPGAIQGLQPVYDSSGNIIDYRPIGLVQGCNEGDVQCQKQAQQIRPGYGLTKQTISQQPSVTTPGQQIIPVYGPDGQIIGQRPELALTPVTVQGQQPIYSPSGQLFDQKFTPGIVQVCQEGDQNCQKQVQQNVPVYGPNGQIIGYQPSVTTTPGSVQSLQPIYGPGKKIVPTPTQGAVQICQHGDEGCQKQAEQNVPVYGPNGQIVGYQPRVTSTPGAAPEIQPVYDSNGKIIGYRPTGLVQGCKEGDVQCQKQAQQVRPVYGPNGQIIGQQVTSTPETVQSLRPIYGPDGEVVAHTPTVSPTTSRPVYGGKIYRPGSTAKPLVTTPSYFKPSSVGTTPAPFRNLGTTPAGVVINTVGSDAERPLAESDRKAVTINYDISITPEGYSYNFDTSNGIHVDETGIVKDGNKATGSYSYIGDDGKEYHVSYEADENGFKPSGDHLPTPPPIPVEIQRVIEQAAKDKQAGISDDGSYDEVKYGHDRYERPYRPQSGEIQRPTTGRKPSKQSYDKNVEPEEGYQYAPPEPKFTEESNRFPPRLPGRGDAKRPQGRYEESDQKFTKQPFITPNVHRGDKDSYEEGPSVTTYRPSGIAQPGQLDKFGRPISSSRPGGVIGRTTYKPSVSPQSQVDKFGRPYMQQFGEDVIGTSEPSQVDEYGRPIPSIPRQGYSTTTYRPTVTGQPAQVDKIRRPFYTQPEKEASGTFEPGQVDAYGRPITPESGKGITTQSTQIDKFGRPIYSRPEYRTEPAGTVEPVEVDKYDRPSPSKPKQVYSSTTYRPTETPEPDVIDEFGRPISPATDQASGTAEPGQVDQYGRLIPSRTSQGYSTTTYRPTSTSVPSQVDAFGRPISYTPDDTIGSTPATQVDVYGRPIPSRPGQTTGVTIQPNQVDKFGRPIYSQPGDKPSETAEPSQVDKYGRPVPSRPEQGYSPTYSPTETIGSNLLDAFGRPISNAPDETPGSTPSPQVDAYGRPIPSRPGQRPSSTYRPVETAQPGTVDASGRPVTYTPGQTAATTPSGKLNIYGRPISSRPGQEPISTTYRPVSPTQGLEYQPESGVSAPEGKPEEFEPKGQKIGPEYLSPFKDKTGQLIGEDFRGPKQPQRYDPKTGYHY